MTRSGGVLFATASLMPAGYCLAFPWVRTLIFTLGYVTIVGMFWETDQVAAPATAGEVKWLGDLILAAKLTEQPSHRRGNRRRVETFRHRSPHPLHALESCAGAARAWRPVSFQQRTPPMPLSKHCSQWSDSLAKQSFTLKIANARPRASADTIEAETSRPCTTSRFSIRIWKRAPADWWSSAKSFRSRNGSSGSYARNISFDPRCVEERHRCRIGGP